MQSSSKDPPLLPPPPPAQSLYINSLNLAIFVGYVMSTASVAVPVVLLPTIAKELSGAGHNTDADCPSCSSFSASIAGFATAGTALGKFFLGFTCDAIGARRTMMLAFAAMSLALVQLSFADAVISVGVAQGLLEFLNSVNWPCMAVILATHYSTDQARLDGGIFVLGLSSRLGALVSMPTWGFLETVFGWRTVARIGACVSVTGFLVVSLSLKDAPMKLNEAQGKKLSVTSVKASLSNLFSSRMFWLTATAQIGNGMVRTSERVLGTFFSETGNVSDAAGGSLTTVLSAGLLFGVLVFGSRFVNTANSKKKNYVLLLYTGSVVSAILLALVSQPWVQDILGGFTIYGETTATFFMAAFVGIQYYQIPPTVASTFEADKGLCSAYIDGVSYLATSVIWTGLAQIVDLGDWGWSACWCILAGVVVVAAALNRWLLAIFPLFNDKGGEPHTHTCVNEDRGSEKKRKDEEVGEVGEALLRNKV